MTQGNVFDFSGVVPTLQAAGFYSKCTATIKRRPETSSAPTVDAEGQADMKPADYTTVLSNLPCVFGVPVAKRANLYASPRQPDYMATMAERVAILDALYPDIHTRDLAFIDFVGGAAETETNDPYEIASVEHDSQANITRLALRLYSV